MARSRSKKSKIQQLLESTFTLSFFHKPTYVGDDVFHYAILDTRVRIRFRMFQNTMVIDEIIPLTMAIQNDIYRQLGDLLFSQTTFTVLVSILGDTSVFHGECTRLTGIIVEDENLITVSKQFYQRVKVFYQNDASKYGFYLLSCNEQEIPTDPIPVEDDLRPPVLSSVESIFEDISDTDYVVSKTPEETFDMIKQWVKDNKYNIRDLHDGSYLIQTNVLSFTIALNFNTIEIQSIKIIKNEPSVDVFIIRLLKFIMELLPYTAVNVLNVTDRKIQELCISFQGKIIHGLTTAWSKSYRFEQVITISNT